MKKIFLSICLFAICSFAQGQKFKLNKNIASAISKGAKALTLTDAEIIGYAKEYMEWSDQENPLCSVKDKDSKRKAFAQRLENIKKRIPEMQANGQNLDIQAYYIGDINAFACANGSIRVFAGLMEAMTDDQILAVIGHEIGHVANQDSKDAFKTALMTSALKDAAASTHKEVAKLSDSEYGELATALSKGQYSQKQEFAADKYGFDLMKKIGVEGNAMASSLGVLLKMQQDAGVEKDAKIERLFSTHPELDKRIATLNKMK